MPLFRLTDLVEGAADVDPIKTTLRRRSQIHMYIL